MAPTEGSLKRERFLEALASYIDARISYAAADPAWRSSREVAASEDELETALEALIPDGDAAS